MFLLPVNQTSIFSCSEGRPSTNVNRAGEREGGRERQRVSDRRAGGCG